MINGKAFALSFLIFASVLIFFMDLVFMSWKWYRECRVTRVHSQKVKVFTLGDHSGKVSAGVGLVLLEGPMDCGGCQSGGLTLIWWTGIMNDRRPFKEDKKKTRKTRKIEKSGLIKKNCIGFWWPVDNFLLKTSRTSGETSFPPKRKKTLLFVSDTFRWVRGRNKKTTKRQLRLKRRVHCSKFFGEQRTKSTGWRTQHQ